MATISRTEFFGPVPVDGSAFECFAVPFNPLKDHTPYAPSQCVPAGWILGLSILADPPTDLVLRDARLCFTGCQTTIGHTTNYYTLSRSNQGAWAGAFQPLHGADGGIQSFVIFVKRDTTFLKGA